MASCEKLTQFLNTWEHAGGRVLNRPFFFTSLLTSVFGKISQKIVVHSKLNPEERHWSLGGLLCKAHTYVEMSYVANETE